ncbi:alpha/beta fold hydrolase [Nocardioides marmorisolisilvae]|uniref:Alpha/beta fold hydrolase n=1 Tax=Nocardioides marmorisolisilvae TaxID=1542737 RepID=A0A3N0DWL6_9ACTN|nr:alpha/beta fold hydrolase [Nocardioides marmorisolisilvae]RNL80004.1 alpha/beta fold hydrolase [Nocardioides marmorisolisilvae]
MVLTDLHTTAYGESGSRVLFLHGLFGQGRNWTQIAKALADRPGKEHRVTLVDLPDHGRSAWLEEFDLLAVADRVAGLVTAEDPVALVGHSLGGKVAMALALRHPDLVERLCVVDISPVDYAHLSEFSGYIEAMRGLDLDSLTQRADAEAALAEEVPNPVVRSFLLQNLRREGNDDWRWQPNLEGLRRSLPKIKSWPAEALGEARYDGPVLWIGGETSSYITDEYAPAMDALFPHNRRVTIKGAGHWVHSEKPEVFLEVLRRFVG